MGFAPNKIGTHLITKRFSIQLHLAGVKEYVIFDGDMNMYTVEIPSHKISKGSYHT